MKGKVLFTATVDSHITQFHLPFLKWFKENGYEVHVATNGKEKIPYCDVKHVVCFERNPFKIKNLKAIKQLKKICEEEQFNIIHTHTPMGSVVTRIAALRSRKKYNSRVIYTAHGFHFFAGAPIINWILFYPVEKILSKYTDTIITINREDYDLAKRKFKKCKNIEYVPGVGIDFLKFDNNSISASIKNELKKSLGIKNGDFIITCVARLDKNKNQGFLVDVISELLKKENNIKLLLVGPDECNGLYHKKVKDLKLDKSVLFLGKRNDIPEILSISNVVVSASFREGLPVNVMEAMSAGLPVVGLGCRGIKDLIEDGTNGFIIDINTKNKKELFVSKILEYYYNKELCEKTAQANKSKIKQYSLDTILEKMNKIYNKKSRILHLLSSSSYSGAENVACTLINTMKNDYDFIYCSPNGEIETILQKKDIVYEPLKKLNIKELKKIIMKVNPDVIHAHDFKASVIAGTLNRYAKIISHIHKNDPKMKRITYKSIIFGLFIRRFKLIVGVSNSIYDEFCFSNLLNGKFVTLSNYINKDEIINKSKIYDVRKDYDLLFFGRLSEEKNPIEFINIVKGINNSKIKCLMIGDGDLKEECKKIIKNYNLDNNIEMLGFLENPFPYLPKCKICIMPSKFEGFGLAAIEASVFNIPVFNSGVGGLKNIFEDDKYLICENTEDYVKKITEILKKGYKTNDKIIKKYCDPISYQKSIKSIYDKVI